MIKLSFLNLFRRKTRTLLSVIGIAIGVAAIIILVSLVDGFTAEFNDVIGDFKAITVLQKNAQDQTLSRIDVGFENKIETIPGVKAAVPELWFLPEKIDGEITGFTSISSPSIYGLDSDKFFATGSKGFIGELEKGAVLSNNDRGQVLIGKGIEEDYKKFVGSTIKINDKKFKVKGIMKADSDLVSNIIVMNLADARELTNFPNDQINSLTVFLVDPTKDKQIAQLIELKFDELQASTTADLAEEFESVIGNLRLLAVAVALISAIVAGIGIANTILMSVLDRFREIGSLKAVGWTNSNVMKMIMYEALFLGIIGGFAGIGLGFLVDEILAQTLNLRYSISLFLLLSSFFFAVFLSLIAGLYPAYSASKLDPIEALRS
ncbi:ABC transporter permease [archaeon]|nr:ABC transporter permease [archaeon]